MICIGTGTEIDLEVSKLYKYIKSIFSLKTSTTTTEKEKTTTTLLRETTRSFLPVRLRLDFLAVQKES